MVDTSPTFTDLASPARQEPQAIEEHGVSENEAVFDVPVQVQVVLGNVMMDVSELLKMGPGAVLELNRRVGEAVDITVNGRLMARGEVVLIDESIGVTMTEIVKSA